MNKDSNKNLFFSTIIIAVTNTVIFYGLSLTFQTRSIPFIFFGLVFSFIFVFSIRNLFQRSSTQTINQSEEISNSLVEGDFASIQSNQSDKIALLLSSASDRFSGSLSKIKSKSESMISELQSYQNSLDNSEGSDDEKILNNLSMLKSSVEQSISKNNDMKIVFSEASASSEEISACSDQISTSIEALTSAIEEVSAIVEEASSSIENVTESSQQLLASTEETSAAMIQLSSNARQSVSNAQETATVAQQMKSAAQDGNNSVQETVQGITSLREIVVKAAFVIENLGKNTQEIGDIVSVIREIADQTNLLALNAAIEAARAGEHGRGFAVVADEVRKLAERSSQATKEIGSLIKGIQAEALDAVEVVRGGASSAEEATRLANQAGAKINQVLDGVEYTAQLVDKIANSSIDQSGVADIVAESTTQMNQQVMIVSQSIKEQSIGIKHILDALTHISIMMDQIQKSVFGQTSSYDHVRSAIGNLKIEVESLTDVYIQESAYTDSLLSDFKQTGNRDNSLDHEKINSIILKSNEIINEIGKYKIKQFDKDLIVK